MKKKDAMANVDYIILPKIKEILNENINQNAQCSVLWDGKQNFQVKWRGIEFCVNLQQHSCSCGCGILLVSRVVMNLCYSKDETKFL